MIFGAIWNGAMDSPIGPGWIGRPLGRSRTGRGTLMEVWDRLEDPRRVPGWFG